MDKEEVVLTPSEVSRGLVDLFKMGRVHGKSVREGIRITPEMLQNDHTGIYMLLEAAKQLDDAQIRAIEVFLRHVIRWPDMRPFFIEKTARSIGINHDALFMIRKFILE